MLATRGYTSNRAAIANSARTKKSRFSDALPHGERPHPSILAFRCAPVSIRAPAWGATPAFDWRQRQTDRFNSRSRMGSDAIYRSRRNHPRSFNSRSRMGSDTSPIKPPKSRKCFNSRSRMGSDQSWFRWRIQRGRFNSRSRMGSDVLLHDTSICIVYVSIRAPAWGATDSFAMITVSTVFQFALPHGERQQIFWEHSTM